MIDALILILFLVEIEEMTREEFITAVGGEDVPIGPNGATAKDLADRLELILGHMISPGARVYGRDRQTEIFWKELVEVIENG